MLACFRFLRARKGLFEREEPLKKLAQNHLSVCEIWRRTVCLKQAKMA